MRSIAHQRDPAPYPAIDGIAIHHRVFHDELGIGEQLGYIEPIELQSLERFDEILNAARGRPVVRFVIDTRLFGVPVDQLGAVFKLADRRSPSLPRCTVPTRLTLLPVRNDFRRVTPRHMLIPPNCGGPFVRIKLCADS